MNHRILRQSRRQFLGTAGASMAALPFLSSLISQSARADQSGRPRRFVVFYTPNEPIDRAHWKPPGGGNSFALSGLNPVMESLERHQQDLVLVGDLEMKTRDKQSDEDRNQPFNASGHVGIGHMLTGSTVEPHGTGVGDFWASSISVDQHIANFLDVTTLNLGTNVGGSGGGQSRMSYRGKNEPVHPILRPDDAFDSLFEDFALPPDERAALRARRRSVLDRVAGDLGSMRARLPRTAQVKLDTHLDLVRELETKLSEDVELACDPQDVPRGFDYRDNANFPTTARRHIDVLVQALACGVTDVGSLQFADSGGGGLVPLWPDEGLNINRHYHDIAHDYNQNQGNENLVDRRVRMESFLYGLFAYLLDELAKIEDAPGERLLDNTLVLWCKNIGYRHAGKEMLYMLAGGASGALETGRFVSFPGRAHNDLLVSLCNLMGMDDTSFGDPELCNGPLPL